MQQVLVIVTTADKIEAEIQGKGLLGYSLLGPVQYAGALHSAVGRRTLRVEVCCIATLVKEIP